MGRRGHSAVGRVRSFVRTTLVVRLGEVLEGLLVVPGTILVLFAVVGVCEPMPETMFETLIDWARVA